MKKIAIISANPVEFYPPLWNLLRDERWRGHRVWCYTMFSRKYPWERFGAEGIKIVRTPQRGWRFSVLNLMERLWFSLRVLLGLIFTCPDKIMYIESNSALPVYWYKRYFNRKVEVFIHYYEYAEPRQYAQELWNGWCHKLERYLYQRMAWCSHCNQKRLALSCSDWGLTQEKQHVVPNYPPRAWQGRGRHRIHQSGEPWKLVYVGSLSEQSMYVREVVNWVAHQEGRFTLDFYAFNCNEETQKQLHAEQSPWIRFYDGIPYDQLPETLSAYDVGLIIYKKYSSNVSFCECNKFFEYLTCGLSVWFSSTIDLLKKRIDLEQNPKVVEVDFSRLEQFDWKLAADTAGLAEADYHFVAEDANTELIENLLQ